MLPNMTSSAVTGGVIAIAASGRTFAEGHCAGLSQNGGAIDRPKKVPDGLQNRYPARG
jgi:hypothetical protein